MQIELNYFRQKFVWRKQNNLSVIPPHLNLFLSTPIVIRIIAVIIKRWLSTASVNWGKMHPNALDLELHMGCRGGFIRARKLKLAS